MSNALPQLVATIDGTIALQLQQIPALSDTTPNRWTVIVMLRPTIPIGYSFCLGHNPLNPDLLRGEPPIAQDCGRFIAKTIQLRRRRRLQPRVRLTSHAGVRKGNTVAVASPGVSGQIDRIIVETIHESVSTNDGVIVTWPDPVISRCGQMQLQD